MLRSLVRVLAPLLLVLLLACSAEDTPANHADAGRVTESRADASVPLMRGADGAVVAASSRDASITQTRDGATGAPAEAGQLSTVPPAACLASSQGSVATGKDMFVANTGKTAVTSLTYSRVGASGSYLEVIDGWSKATGCVGDDSSGTLCTTKYRQPKQVSGALAPFNEEMSLVFGGPIELYQLAVYSPSGGSWARGAYWDRCSTDGLVFAGNNSWYECAGFVQSYVSADGTTRSEVPVQFSGSIAAGTEVNVMSSKLCSGSSKDDDCGWSSGLPLHGFAGDAAGSKLFAVKLRMPLGSKTPAYWVLPAQVLRSNQYGCNCRGQGSDATYKGGCGELDVAEILGGVTTSLEATSTLYSFQGVTGGGSVSFARPVKESATFVVIFDAPSRQIAIRRMAAEAFDFAGSVSNAQISSWLADTGTVRALE